jgi:uncharacterized repeat protein (TIGR03803 family)
MIKLLPSFNVAGAVIAAVIHAAPVQAAPGINLEASFAGTNGAAPFAGLIAAGGDLYYGTASSGGVQNLGGVFSFQSSSGAIALLASFTGLNGAKPQAALTLGSDGLYYGTTAEGGANGLGGVFSFDSSIGTITLLDSFTGSNGATPLAALTLAGDGQFYGTTAQGGAHGLGSVFAFSSGSIVLKDSFTGGNGSGPRAALTFAPNGLYYGTTEGGGNGSGVVFSFDPGLNTIGLQASFTGADLINPWAPLTRTTGLEFYGTAAYGGPQGNGGIFKFDASNSSGPSITVMDYFDTVDSGRPVAPLTPAGGWLFYGTHTGANGNGSYGGVYEFNSNTESITVLDNFASVSEGSYPVGALIATASGLYYGTAWGGGANDQGVIYSFGTGANAAVPGPLPLAGLGAVFSWSRTLKRRMETRRALPPQG